MQLIAEGRITDLAAGGPPRMAQIMQELVRRSSE